MRNTNIFETKKLNVLSDNIYFVSTVSQSCVGLLLLRLSGAKC